MLDFVHSDLFQGANVVHAVTTRDGGVSQPPYDALNMSWSRPDAPDAVLENRQRVCAALDIPLTKLVQAGQVHGIGVYLVRAEDAGRGATDRPSVLPAADGLITNELDVYLLACFADCVPLLFWDPVQQAVGVAHAGWRGTVDGMAAATVAALGNAFGSRPSDVRVMIGPSAGPCCYEVGTDVMDAVEQRWDSDTPLLTRRRDGHAHFDLWEANRTTLLDAGVRSEHIDVCGACTIDQSERFFSHRASRGNTGRFAAIIGMRRGWR